MKIYISGKITGTTDYMERFAKVQKILEDMGHEVINPALLEIIMPKSSTWEDYMSICYPMVDMCDGICMIQGWENSRGARIERLHAIKYGKKLTELVELGNDEYYLLGEK